MTVGYVYIMWTLAHAFVFKVGISTNPGLRRQQIEAELMPHMIVPCRVHILLAVPSLFRERHEAKMHQWLAPARAKMARHAGHTEWFYSFAPNALAASLLFMLAALDDGHSGQWWLLALILVPFPVGPMIALIILAMIEFVIVASAAIITTAIAWTLLSVLFHHL